MKKLRVGVWINGNINEITGGAFSYNSVLIKALASYDFASAEITFISDKSVQRNGINLYRVRWKPLKYGTIRLVIKGITSQNRILCFVKRVIEKKELDNINLLKKELYKIVDIIYYPAPGCTYPEFPYIYTLWDIGHKSTYSFPELCYNNNFEYRKKHYDFIPHKALAIFCESEAGKHDIVKYLNINEHRIKVIPLFPSTIINKSVQLSKPNGLDVNCDFIHYCAQIWAHKNHYNLLVAFKSVLGKYPNLHLILTGTNKNNEAYVKSVIHVLGINDNVINLGFVSIQELKWIYLNSLGLVMPTFLGPTNMPLLEAAELKCPVACSDLLGHREQLGDYALYFDPKDPIDIFNKICQMVDNKKNEIAKQYKSKFNIESCLAAIDQSFTEIRNIRFCWGR